MTTDLQAIKAQAQADPGNPYPLITKGVDFGVTIDDAKIVLEAAGIDHDLIDSYSDVIKSYRFNSSLKLPRFSALSSVT